MAIEIYSKSELGIIEHFGYLQDVEMFNLRKAAEDLKLACLQFLPYAGDIYFNSEQANYFFKNEILLLLDFKQLNSDDRKALEIISKALFSGSKKPYPINI